LVLSVGVNIILYKAADEEITKLQNQVAELNSIYGGVVVGKSSVNMSLDYYDEKPVILKDVLHRGRVIEIEPGYIRYSCFNYAVKDTRLHIEAKKLDNTPDCIGFSVPTEIYTTSGEKDVATNAKVWVKAEITAYADIYPEDIIEKELNKGRPVAVRESLYIPFNVA